MTSPCFKPEKRIFIFPTALKQLGLQAWQSGQARSGRARDAIAHMRVAASASRGTALPHGAGKQIASRFSPGRQGAWGALGLHPTGEFVLLMLLRVDAVSVCCLSVP